MLRMEGQQYLLAKAVGLKGVPHISGRSLTFALQIADELAFNWWVIWVLKKRDWIISLFNCLSVGYHKHTCKYGIEIRKTVEEAYAIDKATGTTFWSHAIEKETKKVRIALTSQQIALPHLQIISLYAVT
eukprot:CCRYP_000807-RA/>CCRYP_000807-RA protein AED:0.47 eAED:0.56 QI:0/-1/0/1/-1/1/1/0/129